MKTEKLPHICLNLPATKGGEADVYHKMEVQARKHEMFMEMVDNFLENKAEEAMKNGEESARAIHLLQERIAALEAEVATWRERALVAEAKLEAAAGTSIVYNNYARHGGNITGMQHNTNQTSDMNIETLHINGGQNQIGDNGTMHINTQGERNVSHTPTEQRVKEALAEMTAREDWEKQKWWAVWKVLMALRVVNKNAREFAEYLIRLEVTSENVYENIRKLDADLSRISTVEATEWAKYSGKYNDNYQKQIDTASRLLELMEA